MVDDGNGDETFDLALTGLLVGDVRWLWNRNSSVTVIDTCTAPFPSSTSAAQHIRFWNRKFIFFFKFYFIATSQAFWNDEIRQERKKQTNF